MPLIESIIDYLTGYILVKCSVCGKEFKIKKKYYSETQSVCSYECGAQNTINNK